MFAVRHLASRLPVSRAGVVINMVCPGLVKTGLSRYSSTEFQQVAAKMREERGRTAEVGSRTLLFAAVAGMESHGKLIADCEIKEE
jgi:NAD(P)-dependent dehydrogenase (short-subunit alcohol dehydrogenase family)